MKITRLRYALASLLAIAPLASSASAETGISLTFGVYQSDKATAMYRRFTPVIEALSKSMTASLGTEVDIELRILRTYSDGCDAIVNGTIDFARFGPASYIVAKRRQPGIGLLAIEEKKGRKVFHGLIVVPSDSPVQSLTELAGKNFAFGDKNSTIGRYLSQTVLVEAGVTEKTLGSIGYLGRHDKVFTAVEHGDFDAGALKEGTFKKMNGKNQLRILASFNNVTKPWISRAGLDPRLRNALRDALLDVKDAAALQALKVSGFARGTDEDYEIVRDGMAKARAFEN